MAKAAPGLALGVVGLFLFNIICGPCAMALGIIGYRRAAGPRDRTVALLAIALGLADLAVLAAVAAVRIHQGGLFWLTS
jgi:hypothetical protein